MQNELLKMSGVSKSFGENTVLKDINFTINKGEIVGLVGENGAGKSTLMKIIFGMSVIQETGGYNGEMIFQGKKVNFKSSFDALNAGIGMVHQEFSLIPGFKASENIVLNRESLEKSYLKEIFGDRISKINNEKNEERAKTAISHLGIDLDVNTKVEEMPVAHMQFTEIAREIERENVKLLVLDEPTAVLTEKEAEILLKTMKRLASEGIAIIFITHRLNEIMDVSDRIIVLRDGIMMSELETSKTNVDEITKLMIGREIKEKSSKKIESEKSLETILEIKNLWVDMPGEKARNINLKIRKGEILGLGGMAGQGKVGIANGIMGLYPAGGELIYKGEQLKLNTPKIPLEKGLYFVSEDRKEVGLILDENIDMNIAYPSIYIKDKFLKKKYFGLLNSIDEKEIENNTKSYIKQLEIKCMNGKQKVGELSGGNQQKVCLAKAFTINPEVLFISEPTRGIDIGAKKIVLETLKEHNKNSGMTIILTSSEIEELRSVCDRIAIVTEGKIAGILSPEDDLIEYGKLMTGVKGVKNE
ncbi:sugar ABC transporter ATP-binding protein [Candidatus Cetobacterium colombiensis]|uniref:Sugar ABC transporter ATP-binding protein n=1 Tax=Candidatus Cetobacterium colombiensis TaxID=3073100 RepID=A0ABU4WAE7_9FUSO|nr:sugar ABC transporter ATP-binding protein [Candidatus Cetobacterium colombiensis]MDX8335380.1 sugar ABC transporter ATP-binding protein [Candidatus Cetobacterium colombiensis]